MKKQVLILATPLAVIGVVLLAFFPAFSVLQQKCICPQNLTCACHAPTKSLTLSFTAGTILLVAGAVLGFASLARQDVHAKDFSANLLR